MESLRMNLNSPMKYHPGGRYSQGKTLVIQNTPQIAFHMLIKALAVQNPPEGAGGAAQSLIPSAFLYHKCWVWFLADASSFKEIIMAGGGEVKVLSTWVSPFGMRVQIALEEKRIKYDYQEENLANKSQLLLQMNPINKQIPVLIHNGSPVVESLIILHYIDEAWPSRDGNLLPSEPYDRATARFWADFIDKKFYPAGARILKTKGAEQEEAKRELVEYLVLLEGALKKLSGGKPYFGGETFGFLDIAFVPFTSWFLAYESIGNFKIPLEEKCPNINAWIKRCTQRDSVKKILPDPRKVVEVGLEIRKQFVAA